MPPRISMPLTICSSDGVEKFRRNDVVGAVSSTRKAFHDNISLKEACVELGFLTAERFDEVFHPEEMA